MKRLAAVLLAALVAGALTTSALAGAPPVKHARVDDLNFTLSPGVLHIKHGTKVVWTWTDLGGVSHNIAVLRGPVKFRSKFQAKGTFSHVFNRKGTYLLHCTIHPFMTEKVIVK